MNDAPQPQVNSRKVFESVFVPLSIILCRSSFVDFIVYCACVPLLLQANSREKDKKKYRILEMMTSNYFTSLSSFASLVVENSIAHTVHIVLKRWNYISFVTKALANSVGESIGVLFSCLDSNEYSPSMKILNGSQPIASSFDSLILWSK